MPTRGKKSQPVNQKERYGVNGCRKSVQPVLGEAASALARLARPKAIPEAVIYTRYNTNGMLAAVLTAVLLTVTVQ